ncbi:MAG: hypothetical protein O7D91_15945 [Planctomycetota bacterium]|nr:hypothetical protein [Planctomycetota bacterium]
MNTSRFELALDRLQPSDWQRFEDLCRRFLVSDYPNLRNLAGKGEKGRDASLFCDGDDPSFAFQFSTAVDWEAKIKKTAATISREFPETRILAYLTNRKVGPKSDALGRKILAEYKLALDIRDCSWFLDRVNTIAVREDAAEELARVIVDPLLPNEPAASGAAGVLSSDEEIAAVVYLGVQFEDDIREKGLTKLCYDALVRSALRHTRTGALMSRSQLYGAVESMLPSHDVGKVREYVDLALKRMKKRTVRHWPKEDAFCLTHQEVVRQTERLSQAELEAARFDREFLDLLIDAMPDITTNGIALLVQRGRRVIKSFLLSQGEAFASAVTCDRHSARLADLGDALLRDIGATPLHPDEPSDAKSITRILEEIVSAPSATMQAFLRRMADAYTLLGFLRETPDVQRAIVRLFGSGDVWLDTTVVLPLLAEAMELTEEKPFTDVLHAASQVGLKLHVTDGVVAELLNHLKFSLACARTPSHEWRSRIPFLYWAYVSSGRDPSNLSSYFKRFRGAKRPEQDMSEFLEEEYGIHNTSLADEMMKADDELRIAVAEEWRMAKEEKTGTGTDQNPDVVRELVDHDVENYVGVLVRRSKNRDRDRVYGHSAWWFTLDKIAFEMHSRLKARMKQTPPDPPVLSADFFLKYLSLGPIRSRLSKSDHQKLPIAIYEDGLDVPKELLDIAARIRKENSDLPSYVIRRKIRDALDEARQTVGPHSRDGLAQLKKKWGLGDQR